jgi:hypothetical protein
MVDAIRRRESARFAYWEAVNELAVLRETSTQAERDLVDRISELSRLSENDPPLAPREQAEAKPPKKKEKTEAQKNRAKRQLEKLKERKKEAKKQKTGEGEEPVESNQTASNSK